MARANINDNDKTSRAKDMAKGQLDNGQDPCAMIRIIRGMIALTGRWQERLYRKPKNKERKFLNPYV